MAEINNVPEYREDTVEEIDVMDLVRKLWQDRVFILKWLVGALVFGIIIALSIPKEYVSSIKLAPESASSSAMSNFGSLAAMAGVRINPVRSTETFTPDLYPDIIISTPFITDLFPLAVSYKKHGNINEMDLYTYANEQLKLPWWKGLMRLPKLIVRDIKSIFRGKLNKLTGYEDLDLSRLTSEQTKVFNRLKSRIVFTTNAKNGVMNIDVTMQNPEVAAQVAAKVMENLKQYITNYKTDKASKDLAYTESLYIEARDKYYESQQKYARYVDGHQGMVMQSVRTEQERLKNEMELDFQLYNSMAQQLQLGKAKVQEQTPVFTILQPANTPLKESAPSKGLIIIVFTFFGLIISAAWVLLGRDFVKEIKEKEVKE